MTKNDLMKKEINFERVLFLSRYLKDDASSSRKPFFFSYMHRKEIRVYKIAVEKAFQMPFGVERL